MTRAWAVAAAAAGLILAAAGLALLRRHPGTERAHVDTIWTQRSAWGMAAGMALLICGLVLAMVLAPMFWLGSR